jgi:hypothetical protein
LLCVLRKIASRCSFSLQLITSLIWIVHCQFK